MEAAKPGNTGAMGVQNQRCCKNNSQGVFCLGRPMRRCQNPEGPTIICRLGRVVYPCLPLIEDKRG